MNKGRGSGMGTGVEQRPGPGHAQLDLSRMVLGLACLLVGMDSGKGSGKCYVDGTGIRNSSIRGVDNTNRSTFLNIKQTYWPINTHKQSNTIRPHSYLNLKNSFKK